MNSDRVNVKQQRLQEVQKALLTLCAAITKANIVDEASTTALNMLSVSWSRAKNDLDLTVEMMKKNERRK